MHKRSPEEINYKILSHQERIDLIYEHVIHKIPMRTVARKYNQRYTTVRTIIKSYKKDGRTNRLLNYWTKVTLLNKRNSNIR